VGRDLNPKPPEYEATFGDLLLVSDMSEDRYVHYTGTVI
jgi:hypothetical protein